MKSTLRLGAGILLAAFGLGCTSVPKTVDGIPVTPAEWQAAKKAQRRRLDLESLYNPYGNVVAGVGLGMLHIVGVNVGHNNPKLLEDAVRKVRQTKQENDDLSSQIEAAKAYNERLASVCTELLGEVDDLKGRPHATLDQKKDLLKQIKRQMERADYANKQTDEALKRSQKVRATLNSSSSRSDGEIKAYDAQIEKLQARKKELAKAIGDLGRQRSEISS